MSQTKFSGPVKSDNGFILGLDSGTGIQAGDATSNYWTWRDLEGAIDTRGVGATDPAWTIIGAGPFYDHVPHDILPYQSTNVGTVAKAPGFYTTP